jgi:hypothetical protein
MVNVGIHGGGTLQKTKRVFLRTGTAYTGYAVNYNWDAIDCTAENTTGYDGQFGTSAISASIAMWADARQLMVEAPSADNNCHFAGVVDKASHGVVGPNWITIHEPGSVCNVYTIGTVSAGGSYRNTGGTVTFTIAKSSVGGVGAYNGMFYKTGLPGRGTAVVLAEGAASVPSDTYLKMARLMEGDESGGVQTLASMTEILGRAASTLGVINQGVVTFADAVSTGPYTAGQISVANGSKVGQHLVIGGPLAAASCLISVYALQAVPFTTGRAALDASCWVTCTTGNLTAETQWMDLTWNGVAWVSFSNAKCT